MIHFDHILLLHQLFPDPLNLPSHPNQCSSSPSLKQINKEKKQEKQNKKPTKTKVKINKQKTNKTTKPNKSKWEKMSTKNTIEFLCVCFPLLGMEVP